MLDVGCGKGRFARIFQEQEPAAEIWGLDISEEMLRFVPAGIHTRAGSMTELPFEDGFFDAAYATESLEHAVEIERAVARDLPRGEARRAHRDHRQERRAWGRLETPEWEKWFTRKELERLLRRHCREVSSRFISYWEDVEPRRPVPGLAGGEVAARVRGSARYNKGFYAISGSCRGRRPPDRLPRHGEIFDKVVEYSGRFEVEQFRIGRTNSEPSYLRLRVEAPDDRSHGAPARSSCWGWAARRWTAGDAHCATVERDRCAPEDFYSTTNHRTFVRHGQEWIEVENQRMDAMIVVTDGRAFCRRLRDLRAGRPDRGRAARHPRGSGIEGARPPGVRLHVATASRRSARWRPPCARPPR